MRAEQCDGEQPGITVQVGMVGDDTNADVKLALDTLAETPAKTPPPLPRGLSGGS